jgi:hypothetical protein
METGGKHINDFLDNPQNLWYNENVQPKTVKVYRAHAIKSMLR